MEARKSEKRNRLLRLLSLTLLFVAMIATPVLGFSLPAGTERSEQEARIENADYSAESPDLSVNTENLTPAEEPEEELLQKAEGLAVEDRTEQEETSLHKAEPAMTEGLSLKGPRRGPGIVDTLYLNGEGGDDSNDGLTKETAVQTFERAKALAKEKQTVKTIYVCGLISVEQDATLTLEGTNAKLVREPSYANDESAIFYIPEGASVTLKNITIDGNKDNLSPSAAIGTPLIYCAGNLTLEDGAVLCNNVCLDTSYGGAIGNYYAEPGQNPKITINGGEIYGNYATFGGAIYGQQTDITINGGSIHDNESLNGGGLYLDEKIDGQGAGSLTVTGGDISKNTAVLGGGVNVRKAPFLMSGGVISENTAKKQTYDDGSVRRGKGGGILLDDANMTLSGGTISNNTADYYGGGIIQGDTAIHTQCRLTMTGGEISGNKAGKGGGGIYLEIARAKGASEAYITGGEIINNCTGTEGEFGGGGIYVDGDKDKDNRSAHLYLKNVVITDNEATGEGGRGNKGEGGGIACCPSSRTEIYLNDGGAIFGNKAKTPEANDLYILSATENWGTHSGEPNYYISDTMLGNVPYLWKFGKNQIPLNKFFGTEGGALTSNQLLNGKEIQLVAGNRGDQNTEALRKVLISGNTSGTRGGGIGSNGDVTIGTEDPETQIRVQKIWKDAENKEDVRPASVQVDLYRKIKGSTEESIYVGYKLLTAEENWQTVFYTLPMYPHGKPDSEYEYSVQERPVEGYKATVTGSAQQGFTIENILTTAIEGKKIWEDNNDRAGKRPATITLRLLKDGQEIASKTVGADDGWMYRFADLPKYEKEKEIIYTIKEDPVPQYRSKVSGYQVTNTFLPNTPVPPTPPETGDRDIFAGFLLLASCLALLLIAAKVRYHLFLVEENKK